MSACRGSQVPQQDFRKPWSPSSRFSASSFKKIRCFCNPAPDRERIAGAGFRRRVVDRRLHRIGRMGCALVDGMGYRRRRRAVVPGADCADAAAHRYIESHLGGGALMKRKPGVDRHRPMRRRSRPLPVTTRRVGAMPFWPRSRFGPGAGRSPLSARDPPFGIMLHYEEVDHVASTVKDHRVSGHPSAL